MEESRNGHVYQKLDQLVIVDYFSDYFEYEKLSDMSSAAVIEVCKRCFARLGILETVHSDNGSQFSARELTGTSSTQPAHRITPSRMGKPSQVSNGEETLETSCRSTTCAVRIQKHDYSWYDNKPDTVSVASIHEVYHTAARL